MSVVTSYPGVYLSETAVVPKTVVAATTNLTAFIGSFPKGPTDQAVLVSNEQEYASIFGGLMSSSLATYGVSQFFRNGGIGAWIVRIAPENAAAAKGTVGSLNIEASSPGAWANGFTVAVTESLMGSGETYGLYATITVKDLKGTTVETLVNLPAEDTYELGESLNEKSSYLRVVGQPSPPASGPPSPPASPPAGSSGTLSGGSDGSWTDAADFMTAVQSQLGTNPNVTAKPLLELIAPQTFNLLAIPDAALLDQGQQQTLYGDAQGFCAANKSFLLADAPPPGTKEAKLPAGWSTWTIENVGSQPSELTALEKYPVLGPTNDYGAVYYPWVEIADPLNKQRPRLVPPSGTIAGVYAATDTAVGVWKAPAGTNATLSGVTGLADITISDDIQGQLNPLGINCLRQFPVYGNVVWGSRTLAGADLDESPWKYVPVRRLTNFIELSLMQSLRWAVFEPNTDSLWASIDQEAGSFMGSLFSQGAFGADTAKEAFSVVCDASTTTPLDQLEGRVNVQVGFLPAYPAEFVILNVQLMTALSSS